MAKVKEYPKILIDFIHKLLSGDLKESRDKFYSFILYTFKRNNFIHYSVWKQYYGNGKNLFLINTPIKLGIVYYWQDRYSEKEYGKLSRELSKQPYRDYELIKTDELIDKLDSLTHIAFIEQGDKVSRNALNNLTYYFEKGNELIFSDEDVINPLGIRVNPYFKPEYAPLLLLSNNYMNALLALKLDDRVKQEIKKLGKINRKELYKLVLGLTYQGIKSKRIPDVLYHRSWNNYKRVESTREIIEEEIKKRNLNAEIVEYKRKGINRLRFKHNGEPKVSIIIPFKDKLELLKTCVDSIEKKSTYKNYEIILVNNRSKEKETLEYLSKSAHKVIDADIDFNYSRLNNIAAGEAEGEYLILLNNDIEVITPDWMENLLALAQLPDAGAVGAKLLYPNDKIQHAGVIPRNNRPPTHANKFLSPDNRGYKDYNNIIREYFGVTGACLMVSRSKFNQVENLTEQLAVGFNDIDFCFKLLNAGFFNIFTPFSVLYHHEAVSRKKHSNNFTQKEYEYLLKNWSKYINDDPFYNPNFSDNRSDFSIRII